jgi:hypothetical protein
MYFVLDQMGKSDGFGSTVTLYDEKMKRHSFDVQLNKCQ